MSDADRLDEALRHPDAFHAALVLATLLRDSGMTQEALTDLFDKSRSQHAEDADEQQYNVVLDIMDRIVGYCSPAHALYACPGGPPWNISAKAHPCPSMVTPKLF